MSPKRILLVIGGTENTIGGHTISALTLGKFIRQLGYNVGILLAPVSYPVAELELCQFTLHYVSCLSGKWALFTRPGDVLRIVKKCGYDALVAMDWYASLYAGLAVIKYKMPIVQVIAGGEGPPSDPLDLPGIVVFSEELMNTLPMKFGFSPERLILSTGRIDFFLYNEVFDNNENDDSLRFSHSSPRVLTISRLKFNKAPAILALLRQVEEVAKFLPIQCFVIGDGDSRSMLEEEASRIIQASDNRADIRFLGGFRVSGTELRQADLVVGQGRTVLEAIACRVPAAVCGNNGYFGLITPKTFLRLASTNFTGRLLEPYSTLTHDIEYLQIFRTDEINQVYDLAYSMYDAKLGAVALVKAINIVQEYYTDYRISRFTLASIWIKAWITGLSNYLHRRFVKDNLI